MRAKLVGILVVCCAAWVLVPGTALADTLDQQQPNSDGGAAVFATESLAQTFTAGLTGPLDRVELFLVADSSSPDAPMTVEIRDVSGGSPGTAVLAAGSVPQSAVSSTDAWVPITFATAAPVTAGTQYSIVVYSSVDNSHRYLWGITFPNPYPAGANFFQIVSPPGPAWTPTALDGDQAFKTYVDVPAPPAGVAGQPTPAKKKCKKRKKKKHRSAVAAKKCKKKRK
jgi:hypothetical protein